MKLFINQRERPGSYEGVSLDAVLEDLRVRCLANGETIVRVRVDGVELADGDPPLRVTADQVGEVSVETADLQQLTRETLMEATDYLPRLAGGTRETASLIQQGRGMEGLEVFSQCLQGLAWVQQVLLAMAALPAAGEGGFMEPEALRVLRVRGEELAGRLASSRQALDAEDWVLFTDFLEYELAPWLQDLSGDMQTLAGRV